jgi:hypothetical protein
MDHSVANFVAPNTIRPDDEVLHVREVKERRVIVHAQVGGRPRMGMPRSYGIQMGEDIATAHGEPIHGVLRNVLALDNGTS